MAALPSRHASAVLSVPLGSSKTARLLSFLSPQTIPRVSQSLSNAKSAHADTIADPLRLPFWRKCMLMAVVS